MKTPRAVHLIRCLLSESESLISALDLAQSRLQARGTSWIAVTPPNRLEPSSELPMQRLEEIMEWIPVFFIAFKLLVLGTAAFFAIKSHHDKEKEEQQEERERQARASRTSAARLGQVPGDDEGSQCAMHRGPG